MKNTNQEGLKYQKLYNWAHTLITSGVIKNMDKFPSETSLQKKFGYSRQTVRTALQQLEEEGLITRVRGSGTYVSYEGQLIDDNRPQVGLLLSYYSEYLFPEVYDGIESSLSEKGYRIGVAITKNRLNDEAAYELTRILIEHGHRKIGGILKYDDMQGIARYKGFIQCMSDYGIKYDDDCIRWYSTREMEDKFSKKGLAHIYRHTRECTALLIYNDEVAWVYLEFLEERGIHVPEDLSVVSFDDAELQDTTDIKLLSAIHPKNKLGRITGNHLLRMMDDENWQTKNYAYRFPAKLNDGNSVRKL